MSKSHHFQHIIFEKAEKPTLCDQEELCSNTIVPPLKTSVDENGCISEKIKNQNHYLI